MTALKHPEHDRRWRLVILGSSILIFIVSSLYGFLHGFEDPLQSWNGYYTLTVDHAVPLERIDHALLSQGINNALSLNTVKVGISNFSGIEYRRYDSLRLLAASQDPRMDGFVRDMGRFFSDASGSRWVVYLPANESIAPLMLRLSLALGPLKAKWQLMEWRPVERIGLLGAALVVAALLVFFSRKRRIIMILSLLPWIPLAGSVGPAFFALHVMVLLAWALLLECLVPALKRYAHEVPQAPFFWDYPSSREYLRSSLAGLGPYLDQGVVRVRLAIFGAAMVFFAVCAGLRGSWDLIPGIFLVQCFAWPGLIILLARLYQVRHHRSEHQLFAPIPIMTRGRSMHSRLRPAFLPIALICLAVPTGFSFLAGGGTSAQVPVPAGINWGGLNWSILTKEQAASVDSEANGLGSIGDYVRHRAYQEALPWLQDYRWGDFNLPAAATVFGLEHFEFDGTDIKTNHENRLVFGDQWLSRLRSGLPEDSIDRLLLGQGRVSGLVFSQAGKLYSADAWSLPALAGLSCLLFPLWILGRNAGIRQFYGTRRVPSGSRKIAA